MKRKLALLVILASFLFATNIPAFAKSFSGTVVSADVYNIMVQNNGVVKTFQIRPETTGARNAHVQDLVKVSYRDESGILIATHIKIVKHY